MRWDLLEDRLRALELKLAFLGWCGFLFYRPSQTREQRRKRWRIVHADNSAQHSSGSYQRVPKGEEKAARVKSISANEVETMPIFSGGAGDDIEESIARGGGTLADRRATHQRRIPAPPAAAPDPTANREPGQTACASEVPFAR